MTRDYRRVIPGAGALLLVTAYSLITGSKHQATHSAEPVGVRLSEWKIELSQPGVTAGPITFNVANAGSVPHAFEVEGQGIEKETGLIQPGSSATLTLNLQPGTYEVYCPVGGDSHKKLGMETRLTVTGSGAVATGDSRLATTSGGESHDHPPARAIRVVGGGPTIQILPGPSPLADSAAATIRTFGQERSSLESQAMNGPYSNNVAPISGSFSFTAWDAGASGDSINGVAQFTTKDAAHWRLVLDRVQTKDQPHHPRFGGVILGLYYHGNTGVHTPLVPTINSAVALWAFGHLYRNGSLVTDNAAVHVMLLSRTRRDGDFALTCWDCSKNKIEELQLQVQPASGEPQFDAPGGFLFVNWEKSGSRELRG